MTALDSLEKRFHRLSNLRDSQSILHWDNAVMMPDGGAEARAEQLAVLEGLCHDMLTADDMVDLFAAASDETAKDAWQAANLREMRNQWQHATALDQRLAEELSRQSSACEMAWRTARHDNDFAAIKKPFAALLKLMQESATARGEALGLDPYDACLDGFDPGMRQSYFSDLFDKLAVDLPDLLNRIIDKQQAAPAIQMPEGPFAIDTQRQIGLQFMQALGFDFDHGRLDISHHPFSGGVPDDVRITTRYSEDSFVESLMGILHETGHALYELHLPKAQRHQPVGRARGMTMHESQSLIIEMQACRSDAFLSYATPIIRDAFNGSGDAWSEANLRRIYRKVERGFIRVDADEVSYPLHVILRYRLEKALLAGDLSIDDLPGAWNDGMQDLLGITPPTDTLGCLQDIHWYSGAIGYFPTYSLGAMTAAQLFAAVKTAHPDLDQQIAGGDFTKLVSWLKTNIHEQASLLPTQNLIAQASGKELDSNVFLRHLEQRYLNDEY